MLLDACAVRWPGTGVAPAPSAAEAIEAARMDEAVLVSSVSAWEIAQKHLRRPADLGLAVAPLVFWRRFIDQPGVRTAPLTADILAAPAEALGARLVTGDARIRAHLRTALRYGTAPPRGADRPL